MITNQRQYLNTRAQVERFRAALTAPDASDVHPKAAAAMRAGIQSQLEDLEAELLEYEALRDGRTQSFTSDSIDGIGTILIKARIARQWSQKELAQRLSMAEQQIQRYESVQYRGVTSERLQQVADALKLAVREEFVLKPES